MSTTFTVGQAVEILERGEWVGPFTVTAHVGRTADHLVLSGPSGLFEEYNDAPYNVRPVAEAPVVKMNKAEVRRWLTRARQDIRDMEAALKANDADAVQEWAEDLSGVGATISTLIDAAK